MKTLTSFVAIFLITSYSFSQPGVSPGPLIKQTMKLAWGKVEPIGEDASGTYYMLLPYSVYLKNVVGSKYYSLARVNKEMKMEQTKPIDLTVDGKELAYEFSMNKDGEIYVFTSHQDEDAKKTVLYVQSVNKKDLVLNDGRKQIGEISHSTEGKHKRTSFDFEFSPDNSKILVTYSLLDKDNNLIRFEYDVLDGDFKKVSSWSGNLDTSEGIYFFDQFRVGNKGEVFLLSRFFDNKKDLKQNADFKKNSFLSSTRSLEIEDNYEHKIIKFGNNRNSIFPLSLPSKFLTSTDLILSGGQLIVSGFYSQEGSTIPSGAFFMEMNPQDGKVGKVSQKSIGDQFLLPSNPGIKSTGLLGSDDQYMGYRFILKDIHVKENGGYVLMGERTVTQTKTQRSGNTVTTYVVYHTDDIAVVDISSSGDINDVYKIEKSQQTTGLGSLLSSYFFTELNGKLLFVFTDLGKANVNMLGVLKNTEAVLVEIDGGGEQKREVIFTSEKDEVTLRAGELFKTANGEIVMYGHKSNRYCRFLKLML